MQFSNIIFEFCEAKTLTRFCICFVLHFIVCFLDHCREKFKGKKTIYTNSNYMVMGACKIIHNDANTITNFFLFASSTLLMHKSLDTLHEKKPSASYKFILLSRKFRSK